MSGISNDRVSIHAPTGGAREAFTHLAVDTSVTGVRQPRSFSMHDLAFSCIEICLGKPGPRLQALRARVPFVAVHSRCTKAPFRASRFAGVGGRCDGRPPTGCLQAAQTMVTFGRDGPRSFSMHDLAFPCIEICLGKPGPRLQALRARVPFVAVPSRCTKALFRASRFAGAGGRCDGNWSLSPAKKGKSPGPDSAKKNVSLQS